MNVADSSGWLEYSAVALMQQATVVDLSAPLALSAATLWTQDADFEGLPHMHYRAIAPRK